MNAKSWNDDEPGIQYSQMRYELQYAVCALADRSFQESSWVRGQGPPQYQYSYDDALHILLDDSGLDSGARIIGIVLKDQRELVAVQALVEVVERMIDELGSFGTYEQAQASPYWAAVVQTAQAARMVLGEPPEFP